MSRRLQFGLLALAAAGLTFLAARPEAIGMPYVVFAGNVGTEDSLADVVALLDAAP